MIGMVWQDDHLSWLIFALLAYSLLLALLADYTWRMVQFASKWLAIAVVTIWLVGVVLLSVWLG